MRGRLWSFACFAAFVAACSSPTRGFDDVVHVDSTVDGTPHDARTDTVSPDTADAPTGAPCNSNDDCVAADLCTNAQRCMLHHCIVVGGTDTCDDGYSCTDDACDAVHGRCSHVPNDMRCPAGQFCALGSGCVRELPCEIGDATCARLNSDACMGTWSCDAARLVCVRSAVPNCDDMNACTTDTCTAAGTSYTCAHNNAFDYTMDPANCGGCMMACPMRANAAAGCAASDCTYACNAMYVDLDGDLSVTPRTAASNGCECHVTDPADRPDLGFVDANCDGIDGTIANAIFVANGATALDTNPGTMAMPMRTIGAAIALAATSRPPKDVYVAVGTYAEAVTLVSGVSVFGGYDDAHGWSRSASNVTTIQSPTATGVYGTGLTTAVELQLLTVRAADAMGAGASSYGVRLDSAGAMVTIRGCSVYAGNGAAGASGMNGAGGVNGGNGGGGGSTTGSGGARGTSGCGGTGGGGGPAVRGSAAGQPGTAGAMVTGGGLNGSGGHGIDAWGVCFLPDHNTPGNAPDDATPGQVGTNGTNGATSTTAGSYSTDGVFTPPVAPAGTRGFPGGGGGGGGSGSGDSRACGLSCCDSTSGGGGGGGGGGCPGGQGFGGTGGGGSFAVMTAGSPVTIDTTLLFAAHGGAGGHGGNAGAPGLGGSGGPAGIHSGNAHDGAPGKSGGNSGPSGSGSGGQGGPSDCVVYLGPAPSVTMMTCTRAGGGTGGAGGSSTSLGTAPNGPTGESVDVHAGS